MIIVMKVVMIIIILLLLIVIIIIIIIIIIKNYINNNGNVNKNQVILLKKYFLRLCSKVFKLSVFFTVFEILFQNEWPIKDKAFWLVFVFRKGPLSFKKLFLKLTLPSGANSKTSFN